MSNRIGDRISATVFGQSHAPGIGVVIEGLPAGFAIDWDAVQKVLDRRAPGRSRLATARREADTPRILSGLNEQGQTCGAPLCAVIENQDARSHDYDKLRETPRPGHADYPASVRAHGANDLRGGGEFSGRLTAPLCLAGAICMQLLARKGVEVGARIATIAGVEDAPIDSAQVDAVTLAAMRGKEFPVWDDGAGARMRQAIEQAQAELDSVGGIIEAWAIGVPAGLGDPMFDGLENRLARALFGIPGIKGVEFGAGFAAAALRGSQHNDAYVFADGTVRTRTNRHGGILGGISTGMPIALRVAVKPTPSIAREQETVNLKTGEPATLSIAGRHDPCIVPRAVVCVEAVVALVLADLMADLIKE